MTNGVYMEDAVPLAQMAGFVGELLAMVILSGVIATGLAVAGFWILDGPVAKGVNYLRRRR